MHSLVSAVAQHPAYPAEEPLPSHHVGRRFEASPLDYLPVQPAKYSQSSSHSENGTVDTKPESPHPTSFSTPSEGEAEPEWNSFSLQELRHHLYHTSPNRPPYTTSEKGEEPTQPPEKLLEPKVKRRGLTEKEDQKAVKRQKHAFMERKRRAEHRSALTGTYERVGDYALRMAGYNLDPSTKPTKESIMKAGVTQYDMQHRLLMLVEQEKVDLQKDHQMVMDRLENCCSLLRHHHPSQHSSSPLNQTCLTLRATEQDRHLRKSLDESSNSGFQTIREFNSSSGSLDSLKWPSEDIYNDTSNQLKRKREWMEEDTTPTAPLRHAVPKESPAASPRSTASSYSSWCLVERHS